MLIRAGLTPGDTVEATCTWCDNNFTFVSLGRKRSKCDDCKKKSGSKLAAQWNKRNPERRREHKQRYLRSELGEAKTQIYNLEVGRYLKYSVNRAWYDETLAAQGGRCGNPGCGVTEPGGRWNTWHIDHDRQCCPGSRSCGFCVRGLLCEGCNKGLGHFADDPDRMEGAAEYIKRHRRPPLFRLEAS